ncbi:ATP-binding protein [Deltaproteobacteria bacterium]|nr:ATP-binding protein [Deltaproteobacteria bacterium]
MKTISPDNHLFIDGKYVFTTERAQAAWAACYEELDAVLADPQVVRVTMLIGVPASGKTTWVSKQADDPRRVLFDATFAKAEWRAPVIAKCHQAGVEVDAVWIWCNSKVVKERNAQRTADRQIPVEVIDSMFKLLDDDPPTCAEGLSGVQIINQF